MDELQIKQNIYIVRNNCDAGHTNSLMLYINILKQSKINFTMKFSHCNTMTTLHRSITLRENFDLESLPSSITVRAEDETIKILAKIKNPHLKKMLSRITPLERTPEQLNLEEFILSSLCKSILKDSPYLFIDYPEQNLTQSNLNLVKECLLYECEARGRIIFIGTENIESWLDISEGIISRLPNYQFTYVDNQFKFGKSDQEIQELPVKLKVVA